jgi:hypothetical protein
MSPFFEICEDNLDFVGRLLEAKPKEMELTTGVIDLKLNPRNKTNSPSLALATCLHEPTDGIMVSECKGGKALACSKFHKGRRCKGAVGAR